jgi:hypothetical protein
MTLQPSFNSSSFLNFEKLLFSNAEAVHGCQPTEAHDPHSPRLAVSNLGLGN